MSESQLNQDVLSLINAAQSGDAIALGQLLEQYRDQLKSLAERDLDPKLAARVDASDVVQQTFLSACNKVNHFDGSSRQEFIAWIFQIHRHNIQDLVRQHIGAEKRNINKEQAIDVDALPHQHDESTPSKKAIKQEQANSLHTLIQQLPEQQREAIALRHLEGLPISEISERMKKSEQAVASYIKRGLEHLRKVSQND